jgi:hypothetical protein
MVWTEKALGDKAMAPQKVLGPAFTDKLPAWGSGLAIFWTKTISGSL